MRTIRPLDKNIIIKSVKKTKRILAVDNSWKSFGVSAEIISIITDNLKTKDIKKIARIGNVEVPCPSTRALAKDFYCNYISIINKVLKMLDSKKKYIKKNNLNDDIPDKSFKGPF